VPSPPLPSPSFSPPRRWPWLALTAAIAACAFVLPLQVHLREREASRAELRATVFAAQLRDSVTHIQRFVAHVPPRDADAVLRPVVEGTVLSGHERVRALDEAVGDPRVRELRAQLAAIAALSAEPVSAPVKALKLTLAANQMAATADAIAAGQRARAEEMRRETVLGGGLALFLAVVLVATVLQRSHRVVLGASRRHAAEMVALAEHDALTGLPNRRRLTDDLDTAASRATSVAPVQVLMCDLDGFKQLNDTLGHEVGDRQLVDFAERVAAAVAPHATVYRLGGDEFCVVSEPGRDVAAAVRSAAAAGTLRASVGEAGMPAEAGTPRAAMRLADERMYAAKAQARAGAA
jgi:diguanylate cyclase (GGDEF)-like protein